MQAEIGARGRIRTCTGDGLGVVSLLVGLRELRKWSLQPVLPRHDFLTKEINRLLHGGEIVAVPGAALGAAGVCYPQSSVMLRRTSRWGVVAGASEFFDESPPAA